MKRPRSHTGKTRSLLRRKFSHESVIYKASKLKEYTKEDLKIVEKFGADKLYLMS